MRPTSKIADLVHRGSRKVTKGNEQGDIRLPFVTKLMGDLGSELLTFEATETLSPLDQRQSIGMVDHRDCSFSVSLGVSDLTMGVRVLI